MEPTRKKGILKMMFYAFAKHVWENGIPTNGELYLLIEQVDVVCQEKKKEEEDLKNK
jgi:hypothetical protein